MLSSSDRSDLEEHSKRAKAAEAAVTAKRKQEEKEERQERLEELIDQAIAALELRRYHDYMDALNALGDLVIGENPLLDIKRKDSRKAAEDREEIKNILKRYYPISSKIIQNPLAFNAYAEAWADRGIAEKKDAYLLVKAGITDSVRRRNTFGQIVMSECCTLAMSVESDPKKIAQYNKEAAEAIASFKTRKQKILSGIAWVLAVLASLAFGATTGAAILSPAVLIFLFAAPVITIPAILIAVGVGVAGFLANVFIFKQPVYDFLNSVMGKDRPLEGFLTYRDKDGKKVSFDTKRKVALGISLVFALSVGVAVGALTYGSVAGLASLGLVAALGVASIFPPLAIGLAAVVCVCITALMIRSFAGMLKNADLSDSFTAPFKTLQVVFAKDAERNEGKSDERLNAEKYITYGIVALLLVLSLGGLVMTSFASTGALSAFLIGNFSVATAVAAVVGYVVGMGAALLGQVPSVIEVTAMAVANIAANFRDLFSPTNNSAREKISMEGDYTAGTLIRSIGYNIASLGVRLIEQFTGKPLVSEVEMKSSGEPLEKVKRPKVREHFLNIAKANALLLLALGSTIIKLGNAAGNGLLCIPGLSLLFGLPWLSWVAAIGAGFTSLSFGIASSSVPGPDDEKRQKASVERETRLAVTGISTVEVNKGLAKIHEDKRNPVIPVIVKLMSGLDKTDMDAYRVEMLPVLLPPGAQPLKFYANKHAAVMYRSTMERAVKRRAEMQTDTADSAAPRAGSAASL